MNRRRNNRKRPSRNDSFMDLYAESLIVAIVGRPRNMLRMHLGGRKLCTNCGMRKSVSLYRGKAATRKHHDLCRKCYCSLRNSFRLRTLLLARRIEPHGCGGERLRPD